MSVPDQYGLLRRTIPLALPSVHATRQLEGDPTNSRPMPNPMNTAVSLRNYVGGRGIESLALIFVLSPRSSCTHQLQLPQ